MKGEKFSENNIKTFRPNIGLSASFFNDIIGKKSPKNIKAKKPIGKNILGLIK